MGGSNDPSNLIELTVKEHTEAHRVLFEKYGKQEDKIAWLTLSGQIGKEEAHRLATWNSITNAKRAEKSRGNQYAKGNTFKHTEESKQKIGLKHRGKILSKETKEKIRNKLIGIKLTDAQKQLIKEKTILAHQRKEVKFNVKSAQKKIAYKRIRNPLTGRFDK